MKIENNIQDLLALAINKCGESHVVKKLNDLVCETDNTLTIVANLSGHPLMEEHHRGEIFVASEGFLDFSSESKATENIKQVLINTANKIKSKKYTKIYLVPFGPSILSMNIKMLVYRVLHMETVDILHSGNNRYFDININHRELVTLNK